MDVGAAAFILNKLAAANRRTGHSAEATVVPTDDGELFLKFKLKLNLISAACLLSSLCYLSDQL